MRILPLLGAALLAAVSASRWRQLGWPLRAGAAALGAVLVVYGTGLVQLPSLEHMAGTVGSTLGPYTYGLVAVMAFLETGAFVGLLAPGETVVIIGGVVAGQGHIDVLILLAVTWACALAGDATSYMLGRRLGRRFLLEHGPRVGITEERLRRVERFFGRYGLATILIGRFVGFVRPVAPFLAGSSGYPRGRFLAVAVAGTGLWSAAFVMLGYLFWQSFDEAVAIAKHGSLAVGALAAVVIGVRLVQRRRSRRRGAAEPAHPASSPVG